MDGFDATPGWTKAKAKELIIGCFQKENDFFDDTERLGGLRTLEDAILDGAGSPSPQDRIIGGAHFRIDLDKSDRPINDDPRELHFHTSRDEHGRWLVFSIKLDDEAKPWGWMTTALMLVKSNNDDDQEVAIPTELSATKTGATETGTERSTPPPSYATF